MNSKKWITAAGVFVLGASLALAAPQMGEGHEGHGGGRHHHGQMFGERFAQKLNLTDAQKQQVADLNKSFKQDNKAAFEAARQTRKDFHAAKEANDTAKLDALKPALDAQRAQMKQLRAAQEAKIAAILTADQRAQWEQMKAERKQHKHGDKQ
jgi:Spy/CpxP family protein refolding chaperone